MDDLGAITIEQFKSKFNLGRTKVYELINEGRLKAVKLDGKTLIPIAAAKEFQASLPALRSDAMPPKAA